MFIKPENLTNEESEIFESIVSSRGKNKGELLKNKPNNKSEEIQFVWDRVAAHCLSGYFGAFFPPRVADNRREFLVNLSAKIIESNKQGIFLNEETNEVYARLNGMGALCYHGDSVNQLDITEILAVFYCAEKFPYPMGRENEVITEVYCNIDQIYDMEKVANFDLGKFRLGLTQKAQGGMNSPYDVYIRAMLAVR